VAKEQNPLEPSESGNPEEPSNPFESPQVASAPLPDASLRRRRIALVVLGVILTPIAAGVGGFCCCFAGFLTVDVMAPTSGEGAIALLFGLFGVGAIGAAALVIWGIRKWWKSLAP